MTGWKSGGWGWGVEGWALGGGKGRGGGSAHLFDFAFQVERAALRREQRSFEPLDDSPLRIGRQGGGQLRDEDDLVQLVQDLGDGVVDLADLPRGYAERGGCGRCGYKAENVTAVNDNQEDERRATSKRTGKEQVQGQTNTQTSEGTNE